MIPATSGAAQELSAPAPIELTLTTSHCRLLPVRPVYTASPIARALLAEERVSMTSRVVGLIITAVVSLTALFATAATAESPVFCKEDTGGSSCPFEKAAAHLHLTAGSLELATSITNIKCEALFLSDTWESKTPQKIITGKFTFAGCKTGSGAACEAVELNGPASLEPLLTASELGELFLEYESLFDCSTTPHCVYNGEGLKGHVLGGLTTTGSEKLHVTFTEQELNHVSGFFCPEYSKLTVLYETLEKTYLREGVDFRKTALCTTDEVASTCIEEHKVNSVDYKDTAAEFLTSLLNSKCEGLVAGTVGVAAKPQEVKAEIKFTSCSNSCAITEISPGSKLFFLLEGSGFSELAEVSTAGLELFLNCGTTVKCAYGPLKLTGHALGALKTKDNGHVAFSKASLGKGEGLLCPSEASLDGLFVASSPTYIREDYVKPLTALCSKDEGSPVCKSENQVKSIDYKGSVEVLTNLLNVKCEGLASGSVGSPANPLVISPELSFSSCSGGCFVTTVSGPGTISLQREGKAEEAVATATGFEVFVKCGTTIKCLLGPEKMSGTALGPLTTGANGHLTFTKVSMGKGEGATCPSEAKLDALLVASTAAYIG